MPMLNRLLSSLLSIVISITVLDAQCPTINTPAISTNQACIGDVVTLTMGGGTNLVPGSQTVDWYVGSTIGFDPLTQGTYVGSAQITGGSAPCTTPPIVLGGIINPCNGSNPNNGSEENEAMLIWSGGGFDGANLGVSVNNLGTPTTGNIGTLGPCPLLSVPSVPVSGSCIALAGPTTVVPANAFVFVFTSANADINYDFSTLCALGFPVYVFQSSCTRLMGATVPGAFSNMGAQSYAATFGCPGPGQSLTYSGSTGNNTFSAGWTIAGINFPAPCNGIPFIPAPPTAPPSTVNIDPLDVTITSADCGQQYYSAIVAPPVAGCPPQTGVGDLSLFVECPELTISGSETVCVGTTSTATQVSFTGTNAPYSFIYTVNAGPPIAVTTSDNPYTLPFTPGSAGTFTIEVVGISSASCPGSFLGISTVTATAGATANPNSAAFCETEQPIDLTTLEDPAYPGGTWSGANVSGSTFDAGAGASGPFTITYTPPAGGACVAPGTATITINAASSVTLDPAPTLCGPSTYDLNNAFPGAPIAGVWSGPNLTLPSTFNVPPIGGVGGTFVFTFTPSAGCFSPTTYSILVAGSTPVEPLDATICATEQPLDLSPLADPAYPGGTWSGPNVTGSTFDAGAGASGNFTVTYTPPAGGGGCTSPGTSTITVNAPTIPQLATATACVSNNPIDLTTLVVGGSPSGTWSGTNVAGGFFDPSTVSPGTYTVFFAPSPGLCFTSESTTITVTPSTTPNLGTETLCISDPAFDLSVLQDPAWPGGIWSGPGVTGGFFNPSAVGVGSSTITYTPPAGQCAIAANTTITVTNQTTPSLGTATICISDPPFDLTTLQDPSFPNGTWSGTGVTGTDFNPSIAGAGTVSLTFTPSGGSSCESPATTTITVTNQNTPILGNATLCVTDPLFDLTTLQDPSFPTGTWSGTGVSGTNFNPSSTGAGTTTLTFTPSGGGSCEGPATTTITITNADTPVLISATLCESDPPFDLSTLQDPAFPNGLWSGTGVSGTNFLPSISGAGTITLTFSPAAGSCGISVTTTINVTPAGPSSPLDATICASDQPLDLTALEDPAAPGGNWSGLNVTGTTFDAGPAASGPFTVTYTPPAGGCSAPGVATITISASGTPTLGTATVCINEGLFDLISIEDPAISNGTWTGAGVTGSFFDPLVAGIATHTLTFTPASACLSAATTTVTVSASATPALAPASLCLTDAPYDLIQLEDPLYPGGVWSGPSVAGGFFNPTTAGAGSYTLTYTVSGGCINQSTTTILVSAGGSAVPLNTSICAADQPLDLTTLEDPAAPGGNWSGTGVSGTSFDVGQSASGSYTITYTPSAGNACVSPGTATITISPSGTPVLATAAACETETIDLSTLQDPAYPQGVWSGINVTGTTFDAGGLAPAVYNLTFTPSGPCSAPNTTEVTVFLAAPTVGRDTIICAGSAAFGLDMMLNGGPIAGTWSGPGVAAGQFDAPNVASGTYGLSFTPAPGVCALPTMIEVTVQVSGTPSISDQNVCTTSPVIDLNSLVPAAYAGGVWSGANVVANTFDPAAVAAGNYRVIYVPNGACTNPVTITITVSSSITLTLPTLSYCSDAGLIDLTTLDPTAAPGGVWSGPGVTANELDPTIPGPGNYTLTYTPPAGGCATGTASTSLEISPLTTVGIFTDTVCASSGPIDLNAQLDPSFAIGSWSGSAVTSAGVYTPSNTAGPDQVTFTPQGGCYSATQFTFDVVGVSTLSATQPTFVCAPDGQTYSATLSVTSTPNNGTITTSIGTLVGSLLTVTGLIAGTPNSVTIDDEATCNSAITVDLSNVCPPANCTTQAGTLSGGPFEICFADLFVHPGVVGQVNDGDDVLVYFLDDDSDPDNGTLSQNTTPQFTLPAGLAGQALFFYAVAGNSDGLGGVSALDNCRSISNPIEVTWGQPIAVAASAPICDATQSTFTVELTLTGGWPPYAEVAGTPGSFITANVFRAGPFPSGASVNLSFSDNQNCGPAQLTVSHDCSNPCVVPDPGSFSNSPLLLCDNYITSAGYNNDAVLGANDVQFFIVYSDLAGTIELGRFSALPIDLNSFGITNGIVFLSSLAGENDGSGGVSSTCFAESPLRAIQLGQTQAVALDTSVCSVTSLVIAGTTYTPTNNTGSFTRSGFGMSCDTIVNVQVNFSNGGGTTIDRTDVICNNDTLLIGGREFNASNPIDTFRVGPTNCDTTYRVALNVLPPADSLLRDTLCFGDSLIVGNLVFNQTNPTGTSILRSRSGCDSFVTVELEFLRAPIVSISGSPSYCSGEDIEVTIRVEGSRDITGDVFINGTATGPTTLPVGDNTLTFPASSGFSFRLSNIIATSGACAEANPRQVSYSPQVSELNADIPTPLSGDFTSCGDNLVPSINVQTGNGIGPYTFAWSTGDTTSTITNVGQGSYDVTITDNLGCTSSATVVVTEGDTLTYTLSTIDPVCPDAQGTISISLDELPPNAQFRFDLPGLNPVTSPDFSFDNLEAGTYVFQLIQENGCEQSTLITIDDPVFYDIIRFDTIDILLGDTARIFLDLPNDLDSIRWSPGDFIDCDTCERVLVSPPFDLEYEAIAYTTEGCEVSDRVFIRVAPITEIFIPTAFSPNGDRLNDRVIPFGGPEVELIESFMMFDRWGNLLHRSAGFMPGDELFGWDGTHKGQVMNPGVFVAVVEVRFKNGEVKTFSGDVLLVR